MQAGRSRAAAAAFPEAKQVFFSPIPFLSLPPSLPGRSAVWKPGDGWLLSLPGWQPVFYLYVRRYPESGAAVCRLLAPLRRNVKLAGCWLSVRRNHRTCVREKRRSGERAAAVGCSGCMRPSACPSDGSSEGRQASRKALNSF